MELKITRGWFEKRAAAEADHEVGVGRLGLSACEAPVETNSILRAIIVGTVVAPAVGGLQVVIFIWLLAGNGEPSMGKLEALAVVTFIAMLQAYKIAALPAAAASLLMYLAVRSGMTAAVERVFAATVGAAVAWVSIVGFSGVADGVFPWLALLGVLPGLAARHVCRRTANVRWQAVLRLAKRRSGAVARAS